ncbi:uncharacterized protein isoform X1 [Leptinotarsa decemlineata]|uniref:uncharacterized protein isoform X1 n=1 Tax=Leptinotarsa decemlineata TaxID=7539 RepID=UPI003D30C4C3
MNTFTLVGICLTILVVSVAGSEANKIPPKSGAPEAPKPPQQKPTPPKSSPHAASSPKPSFHEDDSSSSSSSEEHSKLHRLLRIVPHGVERLLGGKLEFVSDAIEDAADITHDIIKHGSGFIADAADKIRPHDHGHKN